VLETSTHYFSCSGGTLTDSTKKHIRKSYPELEFLQPVGSTGHIAHFVASRVRNVDVLFFLLRWDLYGFHKKRTGTHYAELEFLHPVGSTGHVVHSSECGA
jgi:hypothetical protein